MIGIVWNDVVRAHWGCKELIRTVKARGLVFCSQQSYQLVSANYMIMNIISRTHVPHLPYTLYREGQAIGRVNKEAVCRSTKQPREGKPRVSVKSTKVTEPPDDLLERVNSLGVMPFGSAVLFHISDQMEVRLLSPETVYISKVCSLSILATFFRP